MQVSFSSLKSKPVYNVSDGNCLGKVCDILFSYPDGRVISLIVSEKKFLTGGAKLERGLCCIKKNGEDAVLVDLEKIDEGPFEDEVRPL